MGAARRLRARASCHRRVSFQGRRQRRPEQRRKRQATAAGLDTA